MLLYKAKLHSQITVLIFQQITQWFKNSISIIVVFFMGNTKEFYQKHAFPHIVFSFSQLIWQEKHLSHWLSLVTLHGNNTHECDCIVPFYLSTNKHHKLYNTWSTLHKHNDLKVTSVHCCLCYNTLFLKGDHESERNLKWTTSTLIKVKDTSLQFAEINQKNKMSLD